MEHFDSNVLGAVNQTKRQFVGFEKRQENAGLGLGLGLETQSLLVNDVFYGAESRGQKVQSPGL